MRLLVVDDEPPARAKMRRLLQPLPGVAFVAEAEGGAQALAMLRESAFDAVLLDIQMPGLSGLDVALELPPEVLCVFCTAHHAHALRAFELNAVDYLLKPFPPERLAEAVARLQVRMAARPASRGSLLAALRQLQPVLGHWLVERRGSLHKLPLDDVQWVSSADNYIELHSPPQRDLDRRTLTAFLAHPAAAPFVRVHRSHAVNPRHIVAITPLPNGEARLTMSSGQGIPVSRSHRSALG